MILIQPNQTKQLNKQDGATSTALTHRHCADDAVRTELDLVVLVGPEWDVPSRCPKGGRVPAQFAHKSRAVSTGHHRGVPERPMGRFEGDHFGTAVPAVVCRRELTEPVGAPSDGLQSPVVPLRTTRVAADPRPHRDQPEGAARSHLEPLPGARRRAPPSQPWRRGGVRWEAQGGIKRLQ